jgi:hypothetical protein
MLTLVKSLFISACMLSVMFTALTDARSADIPLRDKPAAALEGRVVTPQHESRPLSRREIFQAIQNELAQMGISGRGQLRPGDLKIQSSVPVLRHDSGLQVKKIGFDPIRRETVFELWASHEPQYLPFEVTTRRDPQSLGLAPHLVGNPGEVGGGFQTENPTAGQGMGRARSTAPVLAKPGKPATLVMLGENVRITTTVIPLQPGIKGQRILVRELTSARVMTAEVVDEALLRTSF